MWGLGSADLDILKSRDENLVWQSEQPGDILNA